MHMGKEAQGTECIHKPRPRHAGKFVCASVDAKGGTWPSSLNKGKTALGNTSTVEKQPEQGSDTD